MRGVAVLLEHSVRIADVPQNTLTRDELVEVAKGSAGRRRVAGGDWREMVNFFGGGGMAMNAKQWLPGDRHAHLVISVHSPDELLRQAAFCHLQPMSFS